MARTKVMIGVNGVPRIQYEDGDTIRVFTLEEWNKFREKNADLPDVTAPKDEGHDEEEDKDESNGLIQEDTDDENDAPSGSNLSEDEE